MSVELTYAVAYAEHGWPVFPLWPLAGRSCACPDAACANAGKHPVTKGWPNALASVSAARAAWAKRFGRRGIGFPCGPRSGMWALDVDPRHGGDEALAGLERDYGALPRSLRTRTGGDGLHILFAWPDDGQPLSNANGLPPGLDTRGEGGYVVLPPSMHASGHRYRWRSRRATGRWRPRRLVTGTCPQRQRSLAPAGADTNGGVKVRSDSATRSSSSSSASRAAWGSARRRSSGSPTSTSTRPLRLTRSARRSTGSTPSRPPAASLTATQEG